MKSQDPRQSLEAFLADHLPSIPVPEDFLQSIQHRIRTADRLKPVLPRWAFAAAAALAFVALLAGFETGRSLSTPSEALPVERAMLLLNSADLNQGGHVL